MSRHATALRSDQALGLRPVAVETTIDHAVAARAPGVPLRIAITSGKGGVGKTTIAANLAALWARRGRRTLVVDADLGLACLDLALGVKPRRDLFDVIEGTASLEETLVEGPFGAMLLPASVGRFQLANMGHASRAALMRAIDLVAARFEVVIFDTGAGIGATAVEFASHADEIVLVVTPDASTLRDAYAMAKVLADRAPGRTLQVLTNQLEQPKAGERTYERLSDLVQRFLDVRLAYAGGIVRDSALTETAGSGVPFVLAEPRSQLAQVLGGLVSTLDREVVSKPC